MVVLLLGGLRILRIRKIWYCLAQLVGSGGLDWVAGDFELKDNGNQTTRILGVRYYDGNKG